MKKITYLKYLCIALVSATLMTGGPNLGYATDLVGGGSLDALLAGPTKCDTYDHREKQAGCDTFLDNQCSLAICAGKTIECSYDKPAPGGTKTKTCKSSTSSDSSTAVD